MQDLFVAHRANDSFKFLLSSDAFLFPCSKYNAQSPRGQAVNPFDRPPLPGSTADGCIHRPDEFYHLEQFFLAWTPLCWTLQLLGLELKDWLTKSAKRVPIWGVFDVFATWSFFGACCYMLLPLISATYQDLGKNMQQHARIQEPKSNDSLDTLAIFQKTIILLRLHEPWTELIIQSAMDDHSPRTVSHGITMFESGWSSKMF